MNFFDPLASADAVYRLSAILIACGILQATLPLLANRKMFRPGGLYPMYLEDRYPLAGRRRWTAAILDHPGISIVLWMRLLGSLWLLASAWEGSAQFPAALTLLGTGCLLSFRMSLIEDNAASMNHVVLATLTLHTFRPDSALIATAGLCFTALQLCLAYVPGGVAKIRARNWRNGSHFAKIFADSMLRFPALGRFLLRHPAVAKVASWGTIGLQITFPFALFAEPGVCAALIGLAFSFHLGIALFMGLPNFLWTFAACYPAVVYVNHQWRENGFAISY